MAGSEREEASPAGEPGRRRSCALCNKHKVKCLGGIPCRHCIESKQKCTPQGPGARSVLQRVASLEKDRNQTAKQIQDLQQELSDLRSGTSLSGTRVQSARANTIPPSEAEEEESGSYSQETESVSRRQDRQRQQTGDVPEGTPSHEDEEDITLIDTIRFGKRKMMMQGSENEADQTHPRGGHGNGKRARRSGVRPEQEVENMLVMEKVSLDIFFKRCADKLPFIEPEHQMDLAKMRASGSMLYWTMIAAGSREAQELVPIHLYAENLAVESSRNTLFGRQPTLDDVRGLLINWMFLSEARSPGHVVGVAHDLRLGARCAELCKAYEGQRAVAALNGVGSFNAVAELRELLRLDGYLFMIDRITAAVTDRPHLMTRDEIARTCAILLDFDDVPLTDMRLVAQVEVADMMASVRSAFSATTSFRNNITLIPMWSDHLDRWLQKWNAKVNDWRVRRLAVATSAGVAGGGADQEKLVDTLLSSLRFVYEISRLYVNAFPLQGLHEARDLTPKQLQCMDTCVLSARSVCVQAVRHNQPNNVIYTSNMTQFQLCFAAVFLLRMVKLLPGQFDETRILGEVEDLASLLGQISGAYYGHRIFQMLRHIEKTRRQSVVPAAAGSSHPIMMDGMKIPNVGSWQGNGGNHANADVAPVPVAFDPGFSMPVPDDMRGFVDWDIELGIGAFWEHQGMLNES